VWSGKKRSSGEQIVAKVRTDFNTLVFVCLNSAESSVYKFFKFMYDELDNALGTIPSSFDVSLTSKPFSLFFIYDSLRLVASAECADDRNMNGR